MAVRCLIGLVDLSHMRPRENDQRSIVSVITFHERMNSRASGVHENTPVVAQTPT